MAAVIFAVLVLAAASSGAVFKPGEWYLALRKPAWTPPNWAFPVVWSVLYVMIGVAGWKVWTEAGWSLAMAFWGGQLVLNALWSFIFFGRKRMDLALLELAGLWITIVGFIVVAWPISKVASLLFVPYLMWVSAAGLLNYSVLRLNRVG